MTDAQEIDAKARKIMGLGWERDQIYILAGMESSLGRAILRRKLPIQEQMKLTEPLPDLDSWLEAQNIRWTEKDGDYPPQGAVARFMSMPVVMTTGQEVEVRPRPEVENS